MNIIVKIPEAINATCERLPELNEFSFCIMLKENEELDVSLCKWISDTYFIGAEVVKNIIVEYQNIKYILHKSFLHHVDFGPMGYNSDPTVYINIILHFSKLEIL